MADDGLTAGAVARRLGVAVTTLRTWHQRYGLGPSRHVPGQHRRYTPEDLDRLQVMRRLTDQGVAPAEAAAWARRVPLPLDPSAPEVPSPESLAAVWDDSALPSSLPSSRDGGGQAIALGKAVPAARGLARAAMRLDAAAMRDILELVIAEQGVIEAWQDVAMPVLIGIGERYEATLRFIEVEHLISRAVTEVLGVVPRPSSAGAPPRVLLAAADEEQHTLPLEALAAALAQAGVGSRLLGARVPVQALLDAVARTGPAVVVLWSQLPRNADLSHLTRLAAAPHPPLLIAAAGPGWPHELPPGVVQLTNLTEAVKLIHGAVG
ncbi:MerR family transcriptional regulator [Micromonosporaceae bacterium Da 78-11]